MSDKPAAWNVSAMFTAAPELWRDCVFYAMGFGPNISEMVYGLPVDIGNLAGGAITTPEGVAGRATEGTGSNYRFTLNDYQRDFPQGRHTVLVYGRVRSSASGGQMFNCGNSVNWFGFNGGGPDLIAQWDDNSTKVELTNGTSINDDTIHQFVARQTLSGGVEKYQLYLDGVLEDDANINNRFTIDGTTLNVEAGGAPWNTTANCESDFLHAIIWRRDLLDDELEQLRIDPSIMLRTAGF